MRSCSLCKKVCIRAKGPFFKVPHDERRRKLWSEACRMHFSTTAMICVDHFLSTDLIRGAQRVLLMPNAVPYAPLLENPMTPNHTSELPFAEVDVSKFVKKPVSISQLTAALDPLSLNTVTSDHDDYEDTTMDSSHSTADVDKAFCDALNSFRKLCQTREERKGNEALHGFVQMIIATLGAMSARKQTKAILRITELMMQINFEPDDD